MIDIKDILVNPNEAERNQNMAQYLSDTMVKASDTFKIEVVGNTIIVILELLGGGGFVKIVRVMFKNKDSLYKVYRLLSCLWKNEGKVGMIFIDAVKKVTLNFGESLGSIF